jgi:mono/diheme cytochrome c family protein
LICIKAKTSGRPQTSAMRPRTSPWLGAAALLASLLLAQPAGAQGDPAAGRNLAQRVCSTCHAIAEQPLLSPRGPAPSFAEVARNRETTEIGLRAFLQTPHARMPNLILSREESDDVISYILSLRRP